MPFKSWKTGSILEYFLDPETDKICEFLGKEILDPLNQFLGPETDIILYVSVDVGDIDKERTHQRRKIVILIEMQDY